MAINQITLAQLQSEIQSFGVQLSLLLGHQIPTFANDIINVIGINGLQAAPYSLSSADATLLFNAAQDLANFCKVYSGLMYVVAGGTVNSGIPTNNDGTHFGYPFNINVNKCDGLGY